MTLEQAKKIYNKIISSNLVGLKSELINAGIRYAKIRTDWTSMTDDEKRNNEELRTRTHNVLIDACNILSREMIKHNEDAGWRFELGNDRREIGDFACYLHLILGLSSR
jgi:hypothetical protein